MEEALHLVTRLLMIGLDAAEGSLIREWMAAGFLPHLQSLLGEGALAKLHSPAYEFPDLVWPTIYTSLGPARLGRYYYIQLQPEEWSLKLLEDKLHGTPFWVHASRQGKRCIVLDAPKTTLSEPFDGMQLASWGAHASHGETASHPPELLEHVLAHHGPYPLHSCDSHGQSPTDYARLRRQLLDGIEARRKLFTDLLTSSRWDLALCGFSETHCAGHQFWHFHDPNHPQHDPADRFGLRNALRDVYQAVDAAIGSLLEAAGPQTAVIVFSGHGMRPQYHGRELLPALLKMWGMLQDDNIAPDLSRRERVHVRKSLTKRLRDKIPMPWQYAVKKLLPAPIENYLVCRFMGAEKLDPNARAVYIPNNDLNTSIRINLIGRDRYGRVSPGEQYDKLCDFLAERLRELVNPATGRPAVECVTRVSAQYEGEFLNVLPDLTVLWNADHSIDALESPGYGTVIGSHNDLRTGGHAPDGFLMASSALSARLNLEAADDKDLAPTILNLLDAPVPANMEGRSLLRTPEAAAPSRSVASKSSQ
jgi:predicted AlkP superfamily phosphohydrolase/phosphomutase